MRQSRARVRPRPGLGQRHRGRVRFVARSTAGARPRAIRGPVRAGGSHRRCRAASAGARRSRRARERRDLVVAGSQMMRHRYSPSTISPRRTSSPRRCTFRVEVVEGLVVGQLRPRMHDVCRITGSSHGRTRVRAADKVPSAIAPTARRSDDRDDDVHGWSLRLFQRWRVPFCTTQSPGFSNTSAPSSSSRYTSPDTTKSKSTVSVVCMPGSSGSCTSASPGQPLVELGERGFDVEVLEQRLAGRPEGEREEAEAVQSAGSSAARPVACRRSAAPRPRRSPTAPGTPTRVAVSASSRRPSRR